MASRLCARRLIGSVRLLAYGELILMLDRVIKVGWLIPVLVASVPVILLLSGRLLNQRG